MNPAPLLPSLPGFIKRSCALLAALVSLAFAGNAEAARGRPYINAAGTTFVTDTGTLIRGAIISTETGNVPALSAVQGIKTRGLNAIHCYAERADYGYAAGRHSAALDQVVQMTRDNDLYLVITIGGGGVNAAFIQDFWTFYAPRYANETHVIYEIQNEPVVRPPVSASVIDMEKAAWNIIRAAAPHTPVLLMSYTIFQNASGVLADIAALGSTIDWTNAAIAFHGYGEYGPDATRTCLQAVMNAGYACFQTEFYRWPWGTGDFALVDPPSLYQSVDETGDLERLGVSWLTFLSLGRVMDDTRFKDRLDNGGIVWTPDFGAWPSGSRSVYGNGGEPRAIRSTVTTRIEAEDFDNGGPGIAYHDTTSGNSGNQYRPGEDVDIQATSDTGGGYNVGWIAAGEWLGYTLNVKNPGRYTLNVRVAAPTASGSLRLRLAGVDLTGAWAVPATGDYQTWSTLSKTVDLVPGQQILRFETIASGFNLNWIEFVPVASGLVANGTYKIVNRNSGKAMDVVNASTANGAKIQQWGYAGTGNQQWVFTHRGANQYTITSARTGKAIDQAAGLVLSGDHIQMYSLNSSSANQRWIPVPTDSGYYKLVSANTGLVLVVADSSTANGARIIQQEFSDLPGQQWQVAAPSDPAPQAWRLQWFGTREDADDAANLAAPAKDGIANLLKLATGDGTADPRVPGTEPGEIALDEPGEFLEFTWSRNKAAFADGVVFTVTWSDTLAPESWSAAGVVVTRVEDQGATERVTIAIPRGEGDRRFARLEVTADGQTAVTTPQGVTTLRLPGDGATGVIGINLIAKPAYTGPVSAVDANTVTVDTVDLDRRMDAGRAYALLVTGGSHAGVHTRITGRDGSVLTLADDFTGRLTPGEDTIRITELPTLLDLFGVGGEVLTGGPAATADLVMVRDSTGSDEPLSLYYATGGINGTGWRAAGKGSQDFGSYPIYFTDGVSVLKRSPGPAGIELTGSVQEARVHLVVEEGFVAYATVFAAGVTLGTSDFYQADRPDRSIRAGTAASADHIHFDADGDGILETWYYANGGLNGVGWRRVGGGSAPCDSVEVPSGFFILRKSPPVTIERDRPW
ncbi:CBM6-containing protein,putative carbohydrate-binding protein [Opitutaceae bacterium TAV1]|nr:CBM6-containing protein,putative carbohydrate-binding protein [Opitutaceae bacterium TAV1]